MFVTPCPYNSWEYTKSTSSPLVVSSCWWSVVFIHPLQVLISWRVYYMFKSLTALAGGGILAFFILFWLKGLVVDFVFLLYWRWIIMQRRFVKLDSGCNGVVFIQMRKIDGDPGPKDIVQHIMTSAASTRKHMSRYIPFLSAKLHKVHGQKKFHICAI